MLTSKEIALVVKACQKLPEKEVNHPKDYITNAFSTVLDFQIKSETVRKSIDYFRSKHQITSHEELVGLINKFPNTKIGHQKLSQYLWGNDHWSRAEFLREILQQFENRGINDMKSLKKWATKADFKKDVNGQFKTPRHSIGKVLFQWLLLRLGVDTVKADSKICGFFTEVIGREAKPDEITEAFPLIAEKVGKKQSQLDAMIWFFQNEQLKKH